MSNINEVSASFRSLAESAAFKLAEKSIIDLELRDALQLVKLSENAVRIGDYDIVAVKDSIKLFDIKSKKTGNTIIASLAFYETARNIVGMLNKGTSRNAMTITKILRWNEEFLRVRSDVEVYRQLIAQTTNEERQLFAENRLSVVEAKRRMLRHNLLNETVY